MPLKVKTLCPRRVDRLAEVGQESSCQGRGCQDLRKAWHQHFWQDIAPRTHSHMLYLSLRNADMIHAWMDGWMDGWIDGWMTCIMLRVFVYVYVYIYIYIYAHPPPPRPTARCFG